MKKQSTKRAKQILSLVLTVVMVFSIIASVDLSAFAAGSTETHIDYSDLTSNQYLAMIFTNHNYSGALNQYGATNDYPPYNIMQNYYMDADKASRARIIFNEFNAATDYKTTRGLYELLTFNGSSQVEKVMELEDYYTAILLSIVDAQMSEDNFIDDLNCKTNKTILTLSSNISKYFESTSKFENMDFMNTLRTEDLSDEDFQAVLNICAADMDAQELWNLIGKDIGVLKTIFSAGTTINEAVKNIADFAQLANLNTAIQETLRQIYLNCPDDNLPMKNAARKVYEYASGQMSYEIMALSNAGYTACKYALSEIVGDLWKSCLTAVCGELAVGVLIGQAVGKLIANYCFATDAVDEQLCAISALVDFEDVMVAAVRSLESAYQSDTSIENSDNYVASLHMLMSTYDLGCEYVEDFVDTVYRKGFINNVQFSDSEEYNAWKTVIANQKATNEQRRKLLYLDYYKNVYAIDAPSGYAVYFMRKDLKYAVLSETEKTCEITGYTGSATTLTIPSQMDGYTVTSIGDCAFQNCTLLTSIAIPDSVTSIGYFAFNSCSSLTSVMLPNSMESIGQAAFALCSSLKNITVPDSVTNIDDYAFAGCISLEDICVNSNNKFYSSVDGVLFNNIQTDLICYPAGKIEEYYIIPQSVENIGGYAFAYCDSLKSVTIPDSVTDIGDEAFCFCTSLTNVIVPNSVTSIGVGAFDNCSSLTSVIIPNSITDMVGTFADCISLTHVTIPSGVTDISYTFFGCISLASVTIHNGVINIDDYAFAFCTSLISVTIPDSVTSIGEYAFAGCTSLTNMTIPNSVTSIGEAAFLYCTSLTSVTIPNSVTSIGEYAFGYYTDDGGETIKKVDGFIIYGVKGSTAETYANENGFKFIPLQVFTDAYTGIIVAETDENALSENTVLNVEKLGMTGAAILYEIHLTEDGKIVQPASAVAVKIPVPAGTDGTKCKVYRQETNGTYTDMNAVYQDGYMVFTTDHFSKYILEPEHDFDGWVTDTAPTCTEDGTKHRVCSICGAIEQGTIPATGHTFSDEWTVDVAPTCTAAGSKSHHCVDCDAKTDITIIPATGHSFGDWTIVKRPTVTEEGLEERICPDCGASEQRTLPKLTVALGDVNGDGKITAVDARWALQGASGTRELTAEQVAAADVNGDGKVTAVDARWILQAASGAREL